MRVFHELSHEEIASLHHQRTLAILAELHNYDCRVVLPKSGGCPRVRVLDVGSITTCTEWYQMYDERGLLQGYYQSAAQAVRKLMEKEVDDGET